MTHSIWQVALGIFLLLYALAAVVAMPPVVLAIAAAITGILVLVNR